MRAGDTVKVRLPGVRGWPTARVQRVYPTTRRVSLVVIDIAPGYRVARGQTITVDIIDCAVQDA